MLKLSVLRCCLLIVTTSFFIACNPSRKINKDYTYFQNDWDSLGSVQLKDLSIQPNDLLSIQIFSKTLNQDQAAIFNISAEQGYLVGVDGTIEVPVIGSVNAAGLTRFELQNRLREKLMPYVKEPSAVVRFKQFKINILGEVKGPGVQSFPIDRVTLIDAISAAGDLTETGDRKNVMVIREEKSGERKIYQVNLKSAALFKSPVYQLQQNDIVYVSATDSKLKALKDKKDPVRGIQLGISLLSVASTIILLFTKLN
jgi:polysaccharide biosynthesis/export protein